VVRDSGSGAYSGGRDIRERRRDNRSRRARRAWPETYRIGIEADDDLRLALGDERSETPSEAEV
jgi:hypothetical protein